MTIDLVMPDNANKPTSKFITGLVLVTVLVGYGLFRFTVQKLVWGQQMTWKEVFIWVAVGSVVALCAAYVAYLRGK